MRSLQDVGEVCMKKAKTSPCSFSLSLSTFWNTGCSGRARGYANECCSDWLPYCKILWRLRTEIERTSLILNICRPTSSIPYWRYVGLHHQYSRFIGLDHPYRRYVGLHHQYCRCIGLHHPYRRYVGLHHWYWRYVGLHHWYWRYVSLHHWCWRYYRLTSLILKVCRPTSSI